MTTFTNIPDTSLAQDKPLTQSIARALRDNPIALAEGDATAPEVRGVSPNLRQDANNQLYLTLTDLPDGYDVLEFDIVRIVPFVASNALFMQWSTDNGATWVDVANSYTWYVGTTATQGLYMPITGTTTLSTDAALGGICGTIRVSNFALAGRAKIVDLRSVYRRADGFPEAVSLGGSGTPVAKVNAIRFGFINGNIRSGYITMRRVRPS